MAGRATTSICRLLAIWLLRACPGRTSKHSDAQNRFQCHAVLRCAVRVHLEQRTVLASSVK
eukprot:9922981-Heterocapsa_arctica.AAC.1